MENRHIVITIGRQYGAGGRIIARQLSEMFSCKYLDKEILDLAAAESGVAPELFHENDEKKSFLKSLFHMHAPMVSDNNFYPNNISDESLFQFQSEAIRKAAAEGNCVFIGRCADYILRDMKEATSIFITADINERVKNVAMRLGVDEETARKIINRKESLRASYYNYYTGKRWGAAESYDMSVNSSILGIEATAIYIAELIKRKIGK